MESYQNCDISFHPAVIKYVNSAKPDKVSRYYFAKEYVFSAEMVIKEGGGFMPTASLVIKRTVFLNKLPKWYKTRFSDDYTLQVFGSYPGGALYLPFVASVYRKGAPGSWTARKNSSFENQCKVMLRTNQKYFLLEESLPRFKWLFRRCVLIRNLEFLGRLLKYRKMHVFFKYLLNVIALQFQFRFRNEAAIDNKSVK